MEPKNQSFLSKVNVNNSRCIICGHEDNLEFCSNCGHQLISTNTNFQPSAYYIEVLQDVISPLLTGLTTFCLLLLQPLNGFNAIFYGKKIESNIKTIDNLHLPIITAIWKKGIKKKQNILEPAQYLAFTIIFYLLALGINFSTIIKISISDVPLISKIMETISSEAGGLLILLIVSINLGFFAQVIMRFFPKVSDQYIYQFSLYFNGTNLLLALFFGVVSYYFVPLMTRFAVGDKAFNEASRLFGSSKIWIMPTDLLNPKEYPLFAFFILSPLIFFLQTVVIPTIIMPRVLGVVRIRFFLALLSGYLAIFLSSAVSTIFVGASYFVLATLLSAGNWWFIIGLLCFLVLLILISTFIVNSASKIFSTIQNTFKVSK